MTLHIGRFETPAGDADPVFTVSHDGAKLSISGSTASTSGLDVDRAKVMRQQLLGYTDNPDESFVPVHWSAQPELDGFYRVTGASLDGQRATGPMGLWDWSVELERVQSFAAPLFEQHASAVLRSGETGTPGQRLGVPGIVSDTYVGTGVSTATGPIQRTSVSTVGEVFTYQVDPEHFYDGASTIEHDGEVIVGRQGGVSVDGLVLSNGILRVTFSVVDEHPRLLLEKWDGSAWVKPTQVRFGMSTEIEWKVLPLITVLRNAPEAIAIRITLFSAADGRMVIPTDFTLFRGDTEVRLYGSVPYYLGTLPNNTTGVGGGGIQVTNGLLAMPAGSPTAGVGELTGMLQITVNNTRSLALGVSTEAGYDTRWKTVGNVRQDVVSA